MFSLFILSLVHLIGWGGGGGGGDSTTASRSEINHVLAVQSVLDFCILLDSSVTKLVLFFLLLLRSVMSHAQVCVTRNPVRGKAKAGIK